MAFPVAPNTGDKHVVGNVSYEWNGYAWDVVDVIGNASMFTYEFVAAEGQTVFDVQYYAASKYVDVWLNGMKLAGSEYVATSGSTVVLAVGATADDVVCVKVYDMIEVANAVTPEMLATKTKVNDAVTNTVDTWSSQKIANEIQNGSFTLAQAHATALCF